MSRLKSALAGLVVATALCSPVWATLPPSVDGQPLPSLAPMLEKVTPAVVNISSRHHVRVRDPFLDDPFFRQFFGLPGAPRERVEQALGSGVIVDAGKGYILTNNHVINGAEDITVTLQDNRTFKAKVVGTDPGTGAGGRVDHRVDADHLPGQVDQRTARVAGVDRSVGLDEVLIGLAQAGAL